MEITNTATRGPSYIDIRVGECQVHQVLLNASNLAAHDDVNGSLPVGLPVRIDGTAVGGAGQTVFGLIGPEPVELGAANHFGNCFISGAFNRDAIEDNLGRVLSADELSAIAVEDTIRLI